MSYFKNFPRIPYEFNINGEPVLINMMDIALNVRARKKLLNDVLVYDEYDIEDGETPESISERLYGTPFYHWLIMLVNNKFDYIEDFPRRMVDLEQYVTEKYGAGNEYAQHMIGDHPHFVDRNGKVVSKLTREMFESVNSDIPAEEIDTEFERYERRFSSVSNREFEESLNESKRRIRVIHSDIIERVASELTSLIKQ